jgi:hypothetical protein
MRRGRFKGHESFVEISSPDTPTMEYQITREKAIIDVLGTSLTI